MFAETEKESLALIQERLLPVPLFGDTEGVLTMKRKDKDREYYFLVNTQNKKREISLSVESEGVEFWYPETGKIRKIFAGTKGEEYKVGIKLSSYGSVIIATSKRDDVSFEKEEDQKLIAQYKLTKNWRSVSPEGQEKNAILSFHAAGYHGYSGEVKFRKVITLKERPLSANIEFENTDGYLALYVNGVFVGARLWSPFDFEIGTYLKKGKK